MAISRVLDFGSGFKLTTGGTAGSYIELCSQMSSFTCASSRPWWVETQLKFDDHDDIEFFFGIAEPICGSTNLVNTASTFSKAAGRDRVGLTKLTHDSDTISIGVTQNVNGNENVSLTNSLTYNADNSVMKMGIYWDGITKIYFYGSINTSGSNQSNMSLLHTYTGSSTNVLPNDSNNYLRLFINNGSANIRTCTVNYLRGKILKSNSSTLYSY